MKLLLIAYNEAIDEEVMEALAAAGADAYTQWTGVLGRGRTSGPHLLSHVWPKANNVLAVVAEDGVAAGLLAAVAELKQHAASEGIKAFVLNVEQAT